MTNHYELLYLVAASYTEEELLPIKDNVSEIIKKFGGRITLEDSLGKKKLAYPIKTNFQGYYLIYEFDLEGAKLKELNQTIKLTNEILRHVIVKKPIKALSLLKTTQKKIEQQKTDTIKEEKTKKEQEQDKDKIKLEELDEKLDEILEGNIM
ncbi:MAG: 30S ribosomal protein S6 [Patescibacteria group bacterium]|jgi:small subunit ribosomal protein S6|nr:30S ribosomal protein S6 [Patescibacteria group bacterium]